MTIPAASPFFAANNGWWVPAHGFASVGLVMILSMLTFIVASLATQPSTGTRTGV